MEKKNQKNTYNLNSGFTIHDFKIQDHINEIDINTYLKGIEISELLKTN